MIWASPSNITLAIWVRVTGDAHITRVFFFFRNGDP